MQVTTLTPTEESLMKLLWKLGTFHLKDVMEQHPEPKPHQNTISTYLKILTEKNFLGVEKEGRIFKYSVKIPYEDYKAFLIRNILSEHFGNSSKNFVRFLIDEKLINHNDLNEYFEVRTTIVPITDTETEKSNPISKYLESLTSGKDDKKKKKKKKKK